MNTILEVIGLRKEFGGITALDGVNFKVSNHQIKAIIGPNGAGKTTLFNIICGLYYPTSGIIKFKNSKINGLKPYLIAKKGICRTFQNIQIFENMSVLENVMIGRHCRTKSEILPAMIKLKKTRYEEREARAFAQEMLAFVGLETKAFKLSSNLNIREQRLLEFARALATEPELLLLDEPASGLNIRETEAMTELICKIRDSGVTILLVEHDMSVVMEISDEVIVLNSGKVLAEGTPEKIQNNEAVIAAYLGEE
ncbi:ABC transporter ATP-binding protein [Candidatus Aerophobetes bacterium]|nr:ABC transporter ATP-binding protein [Candidatus Aerophobetes bacterium]